MKHSLQLFFFASSIIHFCLNGCALDKSPSTSKCSDNSCQTQVNSGDQVYRYSVQGSSGILEHKTSSDDQWNTSVSKPNLDGFAVVGVFEIGQTILVSHCDAFGNRQFLKFKSSNKSWSKGKFQTSGCFNRK